MNSNFCFRNELVQQVLIKQKFLLPSDKSKDHLSTDKNCSQFKSKRLLFGVGEIRGIVDSLNFVQRCL